MNIIEWRDALLESNLNYKAKFIGLVLSQFYRSNHATFPAIRTLSNLSGLTINPVQQGIKELEKTGFISRKQERVVGNRFISNLYIFNNVIDLHVSPRDTSNDTSLDTSNDTSPRDTEVEEKKKKEERKKVSKKEGQNFILPLPDWLPKDDWLDYLEMRDKKGKGKATNRAKQLIILKLDEMRKKGHDPSEALQQSIINSWTSVFEVKQENRNGYNNNDKHQRTLEAATRGHIRADNLDF